MIQAGEHEQASGRHPGGNWRARVAAEIAAMKTRPSWPALVATMDWRPRQIRALATYRFDAAG